MTRVRTVVRAVTARAGTKTATREQAGARARAATRVQAGTRARAATRGEIPAVGRDAIKGRDATRAKEGTARIPKDPVRTVLPGSLTEAKADPPVQARIAATGI